ncbi:hypothetical protein [Tautonia plasticadhaerens]|uniref:Uncharacterized protein n=1 Tax=Tautonia plasticadhaerens TaxID=2527974 RepID=A0A518HCL5_9BACT|nr:hypothetical protein [Tautonia plasticadhaerens]QDV38601.1 hypothetical protein ElP_65560 [Tautonia plasticadhaerens]
MLIPHRTRRGFLADVGRGALVATLGSGMAADMGFAARFGSEDGGDRLAFGPLDPLVALMQETPSDRLLPALVDRLQGGTPIRDLVAAAAFANARTFGGEDYIGYHTMMALAPAYQMSRELPEGRRALPVLKVLYRNTSRIHDSGKTELQTLRPVEPLCCLPEGRSGGEALRDAVRTKDMEGAEATFATLAQGSADQAFNDLLYAVQDNTEVHRTVLPYRAWDLLGIIGQEQAHTLLRQSVRYCVVSEREWQHTEETDRPRVILPRLMDQYTLEGRPIGDRQPDDAWVDHLSRTIFEATPEAAAEAAAAAIAEGMAPGAIGEAIALAANQLVLRDAGRTEREVQPGKPLGSVHGDSIGVHACDSANAWRNMAAASNPRNTCACLILGAYQVALDRVNRGGDFLAWEPYPRPEELGSIRSADQGSLLGELDAAVRGNEQALAAALVHRLGETSADPEPIFNLLLGYAVSEDGALHAEKYYRTTREEFASTRPAFRWRQLVALARVTASEFGRPAPGYAEACELIDA